MTGLFPILYDDVLLRLFRLWLCPLPSLWLSLRSGSRASPVSYLVVFCRIVSNGNKKRGDVNLPLDWLSLKIYARLLLHLWLFLHYIVWIKRVIVLLLFHQIDEVCLASSRPIELYLLHCKALKIGRVFSSNRWSFGAWPMGRSADRCRLGLVGCRSSPPPTWLLRLSLWVSGLSPQILQ